MASNSKNIAELLNGDTTLTATDIADDAVTSAKIATGAVVADGLGAGSVTATKLGASAVTTAKINAGAVTVNKVTGDLGRRNMSGNGAMQVSQRATSVSGINNGNARVLDRHTFYASASAGTHTLSQSEVVPSGEGFSHSLKIDCTSAGNYSTAGDNAFLRLAPVEIQDCAKLSYGTSGAKKITVSFWTRASYTGTFTALIVTHDSAQRNIIKTFTISSADTWQKVVLTYDGDTTITTGSTYYTGALINMGISLDIWMGGGSNYTGGSQSDGVWRARSAHNTSILEGNGTLFGTNTSHDFYITGVQVEQNDTATEFEHRSFAEELSACQRYCQVWSEAGDALIFAGKGQGTTQIDFGWPLAVPLRISPTLSQTGTGWRAFRPSSNLVSSTATPVVTRFGGEHPFIALRVGSFPSSSFSNNYTVNIGPVALTKFIFDSEH